MADYKQYDQNWHIETFRKFSGTIHGLYVTVREMGGDDDDGRSVWDIFVRYPGITDGIHDISPYRMTVNEALGKADRLARQLSIGYDLGRRPGAKSNFPPDTKE